MRRFESHLLQETASFHPPAKHLVVSQSLSLFFPLSACQANALPLHLPTFLYPSQRTYFNGQYEHAVFDDGTELKERAVLTVDVIHHIYLGR